MTKTDPNTLAALATLAQENPGAALLAQQKYDAGKKSGAAYFWWWALLGAFGAHRLYLRQPVQALLRLPLTALTVVGLVMTWPTLFLTIPLTLADLFMGLGKIKRDNAWLYGASVAAFARVPAPNIAPARSTPTLVT